MDCQTALEQLDCVRPNSGDLELPEFAEARAHLTECAACQAEFDRRQQFDTEIGRIAADVPVPATLRMSLLAAVSDSVAEFAESSSAAEGQAAETHRETQPRPVTDGARSPLKRARLAASLSACLLIAAVSVALWKPGPAQLSIATIQSGLELRLPRVTFDGTFPVDLPPSWIGHPGLRVSETLSGLDLDGRDGHDGAAAYFAFSARRAAPVRGILVALPVDRVSDLPTATDFRRAPVAYPQTGVVSIAWQEGDLVYLCFVAGDTTLLERLQRGMTGTAA